MSVLLIVDIEVTNPEGFMEYANTAPALMMKEYGAKLISHDSQAVTYEGEWNPKTMIVWEFPDHETVQRFHNSKEYKAIVGIRHANAITRSVAVCAG